MPEACPTAGEVARALRAGRRSATEIVRACLARIDALEERLLAWVTVDAEGALSRAAALDAEAARGRWRGPLHGVPIGVKDIFYTAGLRTTGGSTLLEDFVPEHDATAVARLRAAGGIVLGKTRTSEFAVTDPAGTRNPWHPEHTPGGSSAGSAAAVSSGMCPLALGSQTGGSVSRPAAYCGVVGIKPAHGRTSLFGVLPVSFSLDHVGALARSVEDAALLLSTIAGPDAADPLCLREPAPDYLDALVPPHEPPRLVRVPELFERAGAEAREAAERAARRLAAAGASRGERTLGAPLDTVLRDHAVIMAAEGAAVHAERFRAQPEAYRPKIRRFLEYGSGLSAIAYAGARLHQLRFRHALLERFGPGDVLLSPAALDPAPRDLGTTGEPTLNSPWSFAGWPTVVLPADLSAGGLPLGIQLAARPDAEPGLVRAAVWCEAALGFAERPPLEAS